MSVYLVWIFKGSSNFLQILSILTGKKQWQFEAIWSNEKFYKAIIFAQVYLIKCGLT